MADVIVDGQERGRSVDHVGKSLDGRQEKT